MTLSSRVLAVYLFCPEGRQLERVVSPLLQRGTSARALKFQRRKPLNQIILDMASSVSLTYGNQESSAHNGYFEFTC